MKRWIAALVAVLVLASATPQAQTFSAQIQAFWNQLRTGGLTFVTLHLNASSYANWGAAIQASGYGLRDSAGTMQVKNSGGAWTNILAAAAGNAPADATYITQTPNAVLTSEQALSALGTALLLNATGTGVLSAYAGTTCTNQVTTALSAVGAATCTTLTSAYVDTSIALTGTDINTSNQVTATHLAAALPVTQGGTGLALYAVGDFIFANTTTTLARLADVAAGSYARSGGANTAPVWSTLTLPNAATQGDILTATGANAIGSVAAVAAGQVLTSAGTGTVPAYSANPSVTTVTAKGGAGTGTFKSSGVICDTVAGTCSCGAYSSSNVINTWNVIQCTIPASTLSATGDELVITSDFLVSANANTKEIQFYYNNGSCGGTGAAMCVSGTLLASSSTATNGNSATATGKIIKTGSSTQNTFGTLRASTAFLAQSAAAASATDTGTIPIAIGCRNTSAGAACADAPTPQFTVRYYPQ